jgi:hypothetical protein
MQAGSAWRRDRERGASKAWFAAIWVLLAFVFFWPFPYQRLHNNPNELVRVYSTMALVEHKAWPIDEYFRRYGVTMDVASAPDKAGVQHIYSVKGPGTTYLGVPVYAAFRWYAQKHGAYPADNAPPAVWETWLRRTTWALRLTTVQLPCFLFLILFERFLRRFSRDPVIRMTAVVGLGLGTNYLAYSLMFVSHTQFAIVAFGAWALLYVERARDLAGEPVRWSRLFWAGLLAGACTTFEYQGVLCTFWLSIYAFALVLNRLRSIPRGVPFAAGVLLNIASIMWFQAKCFGSPWTPGHKLSVAASSRAGHAKGLYGIQAPKLEALGALLMDPGYGLFATAPLLGIGLVGLAIAVELRVDEKLAPQGRQLGGAFVIALLMCATFALVLSGMEGWRGGWTIGPRYLSLLPPFLALGAVIAMEWFGRATPVHRAVVRGVGLGMAAAGALAMGLISVMYNSLPEAVTRPLSQWVATMIRGEITPYTIGAWFDWYRPAVFFAVLWAMGAAFLLVAWPRRDEGRFWLRTVLAIATCAIAATPSLLDENGLGGRTEKAYWFSSGRYEPAGHDEGTRIGKAIADRERAGQGGPTAAEALRMCTLMWDQAQDGTARAWCDRARSLGAKVEPPLP